jgi:hypothetical protein
VTWWHETWFFGKLLKQVVDYCFSKTEANRQERQELIGWEKNESSNSLCALPVRIQQPADTFTKKSGRQLPLPPASPELESRSCLLSQFRNLSCAIR